MGIYVYCITRDLGIWRFNPPINLRKTKWGEMRVNQPTRYGDIMGYLSDSRSKSTDWIYGRYIVLVTVGNQRVYNGAH